MKDKVNSVKQSWKDLGVKDKLSLIYATCAFFAGWIFCAVGFWIEPKGEISDSVLVVLGQSLVFTASIIGIGQYYSSQLNSFKRSVMNQLKGHDDTEVEADDE